MSVSAHSLVRTRDKRTRKFPVQYDDSSGVIPPEISSKNVAEALEMKVPKTRSRPPPVALKSSNPSQPRLKKTTSAPTSQEIVIDESPTSTDTSSSETEIDPEYEEIAPLIDDEASCDRSEDVNDRSIDSLENEIDKESKNLPESTRDRYLYLAYCLIIVLLVVALISPHSFPPNQAVEEKGTTINLGCIDEINYKYPGLLSSKKLRIIKARIGVMNREVSKLMLLGQSKDSHCNMDPTFCVGQTIANVTQVQFGYIDASDPHLHSNKIELELKKSLDGNRYIAMIDSLEKMPASEVMNLFQFIDKDETLRRRGMLIFVLYTGSMTTSDFSDMKESEIAENILIEKWSPFIPKDSLSSVISRISGSIIKIH